MNVNSSEVFRYLFFSMVALIIGAAGNAAFNKGELKGISKGISDLQKQVKELHIYVIQDQERLVAEGVDATRTDSRITVIEGTLETFRERITRAEVLISAWKREEKE